MMAPLNSQFDMSCSAFGCGHVRCYDCHVESLYEEFHDSGGVSTGQPAGHCPPFSGMSSDEWILLNSDDQTSSVTGAIPCEMAKKVEEANDKAPGYDKPLVAGSLMADAIRFDDNDDELKDETKSSTGGSSTSNSTDFWDTDYPPDAPDLPEGHPFLKYENEIVKDVLDTFYSQQAPRDGAEEAAQSSISNTRYPVCSQGVNSQHNTRKRNGANQSSKDSEDGFHFVSPNKRQRLHENCVSFACPFCKYDSIRYQACYNYLLRRIRDVKQHIIRCHKRPIYCPRCYQEFENEAARDTHVRTAICTPCSPRLIDGITEDQRAALANRVSAKVSSEEQWFSVFEILFPGYPRPSSPYIDRGLSGQLTTLVDYLDGPGTRVILDAIGFHVTWNIGRNEEADIPAFQARIVQGAIRHVVDQWREQTSSIVQQEPQALVPSTPISTDDRTNYLISPSQSLHNPHSTSRISNAFTSDPGQLSSLSEPYLLASINATRSTNSGSDLPSSRARHANLVVLGAQVGTHPAESRIPADPILTCVDSPRDELAGGRNETSSEALASAHGSGIGVSDNFFVDSLSLDFEIFDTRDDVDQT